MGFEEAIGRAVIIAGGFFLWGLLCRFLGDPELKSMSIKNLLIGCSVLAVFIFFWVGVD